MKKGARITGTVLILMIAGTLTLSAQRGMRGNNDFQRMGRSGTDTLMRRGRLPLAATDTLFVHRRMQGNMMAGIPGRGFGPGMGQGMRNMGPGMRGGMGRMRNMGPGMRGGMQPGMGQGMRGGMAGRGFGPGMGQGVNNGLGHRYQMIPNLTEKQTKDIEALNMKNSDEMTKFREENQKKIQAMRDEHRKQILNLLTDEQKKAFESSAPPKAAPVKPVAPAKPSAPAAKK